MDPYPSTPPHGAPVAGPSGETALEAFTSDADLAKRIAANLNETRRLIRSGELKPAKTVHDRTFYKTADLDAARVEAIKGVGQAVRHLKAEERERMFFAIIAAREAGRAEPNDDDRREGLRRAQAAQQFDQAADRITARIDQVLERIERVGTANRAGLRYRLSAATIDADAGVVRGVTVAKSGVIAMGKFIYIDRGGAITKDVTQAVRKIAVGTDEVTLESLLLAAEAAGGKIKVRSDHNDDIGARGGYADNFRRTGDRVVCDLHLFDSYKDRDVFLETAQKTPELAGLSIDFKPTFQIKNDVALMRVSDLIAVDIVDEGAITGDGLFE